MSCFRAVAALTLAASLGLAQAQEPQRHSQVAATRPATAELLATLNGLRADGCAGQRGNPDPLVENPRASRAARLLAEGLPLADALAQAGYRANRSLMVHVQGFDPGQPLAVQLPAAYCADLLRSGLKEAGVYLSGRDIWWVLADPFQPPAEGDMAAMAQQVLQLVNQARAGARRCGGRGFRPAPPVKANAALTLAAQRHARDMARQNYFSHEAPDGSTPPERATRAGYGWRKVGENIAAGQSSAQEVVAGWLKSPGHCENIMDPAYTEMGLAYALAKNGDQGIYWVQVFGTPR
jgi:uncharacterized protein YkwD